MEVSMLKLYFFPVNNAWAFVFGKDIRTATPLRLDGFDLFFQSRKEAVKAANHRGINVQRNGVCK